MLDLPRLSATEAAYLTTLSQRAEAVPVTFLDGEWDLQLFPTGGVAPLHAPYRMAFDLGGTRFDVAVELVAFDEILRRFDPGGEVAVMPESLVLVLTELAVADIAERLQARLGHPVRVVAAGDHLAVPADVQVVGFTLTPRDGGRVVAGELALDVRGLAVLADLMGRLPQPGDTASDGTPSFEGLPIPLRLDIGWVDLPRADLAALAPHDVILPDDTTLLDQDRLLLRLSPSLALRARLAGSTLTIEDVVTTTMTGDPAAPPAEAAAGDEPLLGSLDDCEVRLTFDIGQETLSLAQLRRIAAGAVFDLGRDPRRAVNIRANGRLIGTGELVEVDGRVGVRVVRIAGAPE